MMMLFTRLGCVHRTTERATWGEGNVWVDDDPCAELMQHQYNANFCSEVGGVVVDAQLDDPAVSRSEHSVDTHHADCRWVHTTTHCGQATSPPL
jgi:hypothetical protein